VFHRCLHFAAPVSFALRFCSGKAAAAKGLRPRAPPETATVRSHVKIIEIKFPSFRELLFDSDGNFRITFLRLYLLSKIKWVDFCNFIQTDLYLYLRIRALVTMISIRGHHQERTPMRNLNRRASNPFTWLLFIGLVAALPGIAAAQTASIDIPENARNKSFGSGWECERGFREADGACRAVEIPANAFATNTTYGRGWECGRGYNDVRGTCEAMAVPAQGYLTSSGDRWECDRGFRKEGEACVQIRVPANGYLTESPTKFGWECDRGYRATGEECVAIKIPENGYMTESSFGPGWKCDRGFRAVDDSCVAVRIPENAYFTETSYGTGWRCERGYRAVNEECIAVDIPPNAHLDYFGANWVCDRPYSKQLQKCILR
jgi:hypothetical protein